MNFFLTFFVKDLLEAYQKIFSRSDGIGYVDLDLKIRIFLQSEILLSPTNRPMGFRL